MHRIKEVFRLLNMCVALGEKDTVRDRNREVRFVPYITHAILKIPDL